MRSDVQVEKHKTEDSKNLIKENEEKVSEVNFAHLL